MDLERATRNPERFFFSRPILLLVLSHHSFIHAWLQLLALGGDAAADGNAAAGACMHCTQPRARYVQRQQIMLPQPVQAAVVCVRVSERSEGFTGKNSQSRSPGLGSKKPLVGAY
jgi:hypothetical protein